MNIDNIEIGADSPNVVNVIIEIPAASSPVKYEIEKESGALIVDRFMSAPIFYPANYDVTEYHTYGLNWSQDKITWYVDGEEVYSTENEYWHQKLHMMFDTEIMYWPGIPDTAKLPANFKIDYIRSWKSL